MLLDNKEATAVTLDSLIKDKYLTGKLTVVSHKKATKLVSGQYRSALKGRGMDFQDVREYTDGDDVRLVDWRLTAKHGKIFTKIFAEEKERHICFLIDMRAPMRFATRQAFKSVIAAHIVATLAWSFQEEGDKIGGLILSDKEMETFKPSKLRRPFMHFLYELAHFSDIHNELTPLKEDISLEAACWKMRRFCKNGNVVFVISDFADLTQETLSCLSSLARGNEVILINVYDKLEGSCPPPNVYPVTNGHETLTLDMRDKTVQNTYQNYFKEREKQLTDFSLEYGVRYIPISTTQDYIRVVADALRRKI